MTMVDAAARPALEELCVAPHWVCRDNNKVPYNPRTGREAKADVPETWGTYEEAKESCELDSRYAGIGREVLAEEELIFIDMDNCIDKDGNISEFAKYVIDKVNSYTEKSPSERGIHIKARGKNLPKNLGPDPSGKVKIEMYYHGRYFTWTGNHIDGTPETIEDRSQECLDLYLEMRDEAKRSKQNGRSSSNGSSIGGTPYGAKALREECANVALAAEGSRNDQLNRSAFSLGTLVAGGELSRVQVENELYNAAMRAGLDERETEATIASGIESGMRHPRTAPPTHWPEYKPGAPEASNGNGHHRELTQEELCAFTADDAGNGDAMYALHGHDLLWCPERGWFFYNGRCWELDQDGATAKQKAVDTLRKRRHAAVELEKEPVVACTKGDDRRVNGCINRFRSLVVVGIEEFDADPDSLNCKNGVLDLRSGTLTPHARSQRFTYCLSVAYEERECQEFVEYLDSVIKNPETISYLQKVLGYCLTGRTSEECLFYLYGPTRSGKGTLAEIFMSLLPNPISTMVDFNSFTAKREGDVSNFDLAPLRPSRLVFASESNRSQSLNPAKIKQLTGGDQVRACYKHKDFFSYRPQFKVVMMSNHQVNGDPEDSALWGRVRVIEFPNSFLGMEDKSKKARLKQSDALTAVLYWAVQGAMQWYALGAQGLETPQGVKNATKQHRDELDYVQQWLEECTEDDDEGWTSNEDVSASYLSWCEGNNVQFPKSKKGLAESLKAKGYATGVVRRNKSETGGKHMKGVEGLYIPERVSAMPTLDRMRYSIHHQR